MLTGSMAMNYYAQPRMTRDIDIVVALEPRAKDTIVEAFHPDYYVSSDAVEGAIARRGMFNLIHQESVIKVDFIVSEEDLIISKLDWARDSRSELQLGDVRNLLAAGCDEQYVARWTGELGLSGLLEECR